MFAHCDVVYSGNEMDVCMVCMYGMYNQVRSIGPIVFLRLVTTSQIIQHLDRP